MSRLLGRPPRHVHERRPTTSRSARPCSPGATPSRGTRAPAQRSTASPRSARGARSPATAATATARRRRRACPRATLRELRRRALVARLPARRRRPQPRRPRAAARRRLRSGAAARGPARDGRGRCPPRPRRRVCRLRSHPPCRAAPRRRRAGVARARGRPLVNAGSWTYASIFVARTAARAPTGRVCACSSTRTAPPQVLRLLQDRTARSCEARGGRPRAP